MTRLITGAVLATLMCAGIPAGGVSAALVTTSGASVSSLPNPYDVSREAASPQTKGRYKSDGENCVWDPDDSGPNQCTPQVAGRFKKSGDSCVWDPKDKGPDQCKPPQGRWKADGSSCVWDPKDSGPNQCNPRQSRKPGR